MGTIAEDASFENCPFATTTARNVDVMHFMSIMSPVFTTFVNIGVVVVIYAGGLRAIQGSMSVGQIVAFPTSG